MNIFRDLLICILLLLSLPSLAASAIVSIGESSIEIPSYKDFNNASPDAQVMVDKFASAPQSKYKFLALFLPRRIIAQSKAAKRYVYAQNYSVITVKSDTKNSKFTTLDFARLQDTLRSQGKTTISSKAIANANRSPGAKYGNVDIKTLDIGGVISQSSYHITIAADMDVKNTRGVDTIPSFSAISFVLVKSKVLGIQTIYFEPTESEVANAASDAAAWAMAIVKLNGS